MLKLAEGGKWNPRRERGKPKKIHFERELHQERGSLFK